MYLLTACPHPSSRLAAAFSPLPVGEGKNGERREPKWGEGRGGILQTLNAPILSTPGIVSFIIRYNFLMAVDYLAIGHVSIDLKGHRKDLGGSALYAALTAQALGLRPAMLTSYSKSLEPTLPPLPRRAIESAATTTFAIEERDAQRTLRLINLASPIPHDITLPEEWERAPIIHLAPIAQEIDPKIAQRFAGQFIGVTPQGWMRKWDKNGIVSPTLWEGAEEVLKFAAAVVLSDEDLPPGYPIASLVNSTPVLVLTHGAAGATLYWEGESHFAPAPKAKEVDSTGAGDVFAAAFFIRLYHTRSPIEALRFATLLAADSVTRPGLQGVPSSERIRKLLES